MQYRLVLPLAGVLYYSVSNTCKVYLSPSAVYCGHGKTFIAVNLMVVVAGKMLVMYFDHSAFETL